MLIPALAPAAAPAPAHVLEIDLTEADLFELHEFAGDLDDFIAAVELSDHCPRENG